MIVLICFPILSVHAEPACMPNAPVSPAESSKVGGTIKALAETSDSDPHKTTKDFLDDQESFLSKNSKITTFYLQEAISRLNALEAFTKKPDASNADRALAWDLYSGIAGRIADKLQSVEYGKKSLTAAKTAVLVDPTSGSAALVHAKIIDGMIAKGAIKCFFIQNKKYGLGISLADEAKAAVIELLNTHCKDNALISRLQAYYG